jgi:predicted glycosyltransferase
MAVSIEIETHADHQYVVRLRDDEEVHESWFTLDPTVLERLRVGSEDEEAIVRRTAEFLVQHQDIADFPDIVDLADVMATYDDYGEYIGR